MKLIAPQAAVQHERLVCFRIIQAGVKADGRFGEKVAHLGAETAVLKSFLMNTRQIVALIGAAVGQ